MNIQIKNLTFSYPGSGENVFENVSFSLDTRWKTGLIGRNGRGKTTLLKLLNGEFEGEYSGTISRPSEVDYFPCPLPDGETLTMDALSALSGAEEWRIARELSLLGVSDAALYRPFSCLSGGEQTKALLAAMFLREGNFLLIDEPTNHLDLPSKICVAEYLRKKESFLLVSHDRDLLDSCTDHILSLNRTDIEVQAGNFSSWYENTRRTEAFERSRDEKLKKEIRRLKDSARRTAEWSDQTEAGKFNHRNPGLRVDRGHVGHQAAKMMKTSKVIEAHKERAIEEKSALLKNAEEAESLKIRPLEFFSERLLEIKELTVRYGSAEACKGVSFSVFQGDRIALNGKNGCGKSSVFRAILGLAEYSGTILLSPRLKISYVPQNTDSLSGSLGEYARQYGIEESLFKAVLDKLGFRKKDFSADLSAMSAGQKKKAALARSLCESAHLYIWDEPLNYIDIISRAQIEELILAFRPSLLFVEHDSAFLRNIATKIIQL